MEKDRKTKVIAVCALLIAIISLSIGFAAFSENLTIGGTGSVKAASWEVKFMNLQSAVLVGTATEVTAPTINTNDTNIGDYSVTLSAPGDSVSYTFDIANEGTINAAITSITIPTPTCTGTGESATTDAANVCSNLEYSLTYSDNTALAVGNTLNKEATKTAKLTLKYKSITDDSLLPKNDVAISNLGITIVYSQS